MNNKLNEIRDYMFKCFVGSPVDDAGYLGDEIDNVMEMIVEYGSMIRKQTSKTCVDMLTEDRTEEERKEDEKKVEALVEKFGGLNPLLKKVSEAVDGGAEGIAKFAQENLS